MTAPSKSTRALLDLRSVLDRDGGALLHNVLETAAVPTVLIDAEGHLVYANRAFCELLGYTANECNSLDLETIIHPDDADMARRQLDGVVNKTFAAYRAERRYLRKSGEPVWVLASASVTRSADGEFLYMVVQALDIDRQKMAEAALAAAERRCNFALESAGQGVWEADIKNNTVFYSPMWRRIRGLAPDDIVDSSLEAWLRRVHVDDRERIMHIVREQNAGKIQHNVFEYRERHADGHFIWIKSTGAPVEWNASGAPTRVIGTDADITSLKDAEEKLQFANNLVHTTMETSPDGILVIDANGKILSWNRRYGELWGIPPDVLRAGDDGLLLDMVQGMIRDPKAFLARITHLYAHPHETGQDEVEMVDGRCFDRRTGALRTSDGEYLGRVWFFRDITERKQFEARILHAARSDPLTGLANRAVFMEATEHAIAQAKRGGPSFATLYLDLDHFKDVNDTLGHPVGDELLRAVAERLRSSVRSTDVVARFGGDEFAVMLADIDDAEEAAHMADKLIDVLRAPVMVHGNDIRSGASIGISLFGPDRPDAETQLARADLALYRTKSEGRSGYRFFTSAMDTEVRARASMESELREAMAASDQLFLMYQPQVELGSGRIVGVEALLRWRHPTRGVLLPSLFVPLAERSGLVASLGQWALKQACVQARAWADAAIAPHVVALNVSAVELKRVPELEQRIAGLLAEPGLGGVQLELELTEAVLMSLSHDHDNLLQRLRARGVRLAIDDFGDGYSSFDHLRRFPVDRIKISRNFVQKIETEAESAAMVRAMIGLTRELGIDFIAEGIDDARQMALLHDWGCRQGQGHYFAPPLGVGEIEPLLRSGVIVAGKTAGHRSAA